MKSWTRNILFLFLSVLLFASCKKDFYANSPGDRLSFSLDTLSFDTVFTEKGSVTQCMKIKNHCDGIVKIDKIYLGKGRLSEFYINVNGTQGPVIENVDVASGDSIYVFVQTKLHEQSVDTILHHEDFLLVEYNSRQDSVVITAWGQDVNNYKGTRINTTTFTANKPYVIYDSLVVNEGETLTIEAGARIYLHYNANIIVRGSLLIKGTADSVVMFTSDRLEQTYQLLPGQWGSIIFEASSVNNEISFAQIKNGVNGLVFYGDEKGTLSCKIDNTRIYNMSGNGIYAMNCNIDSYNCIFANCDCYVLNILGGWFKGVHNTIYNIGSAKGRKYYPSVNIVDYQNDTVTYMLRQAQFFNSIIAGSMTNEINMSAVNGDNSLPCVIQYCLVRDTYTNADSSYYKDITFFDKEKNLFADTETFVLDSLSQAKDLGVAAYGDLFPVDLLSHSRMADSKPDVGAIEYYYEEKKENK